MAEARIGTVDIPDRTERERYFRELTYLELSALFAGPLKPGSLAAWAGLAPKGAVGLVAPWVFSHRRAPAGARLWRHDETAGDFRESAPARAAIGPFRAAIDALGAAHAVFRSPPLFAPSAANRDRLRAFFSEIATPEAIGAPRVWIPDGLWEPRAAVAFAGELGVLCALDPLVLEPGQPREIYYDLELPALYLRISGLGQAGSIRMEKLEDLADLLLHYEELPATVVFESAARWTDARNMKKLLQELSHPEPASAEDGEAADDDDDDESAEEQDDDAPDDDGSDDEDDGATT